MLSRDRIEFWNWELMRRLSVFLSGDGIIPAKDVEELVRDYAQTEERAYALLLAAVLGLDVGENPEHREVFDAYVTKMLRPLKVQDYAEDAYLKAVHIPETKAAGWEFAQEAYAPYQAFVCDDMKRVGMFGAIVPQIGYFAEEFRYPAVLQDGREWMLVTPNEINTMRAPIAAASGKALTFGLGLGYYAFHVVAKESVSSLTVVERDPEVIDIFQKYVLPQFPHREKLKIVEADAFAFAEAHLCEGYDSVFTDIWHDPSDGVDLYLKMKNMEHLCPTAKYSYWIEQTLKFYL